MVDKKNEVENNITLRQVKTIVSIIFTFLVAVISTFMYFDERYVQKDIHDIHIAENRTDLMSLDEKTAEVIAALQEQNTTEFNRVYKAIKDGTALPLIVRRDILLGRGDSLTSEERAELSILETKLDELNIQ